MSWGPLIKLPKSLSCLKKFFPYWNVLWKNSLAHLLPPPRSICPCFQKRHLCLFQSINLLPFLSTRYCPLIDLLSPRHDKKPYHCHFDYRRLVCVENLHSTNRLLVPHHRLLPQYWMGYSLQNKSQWNVVVVLCVVVFFDYWLYWFINLPLGRSDESFSYFVGMTWLVLYHHHHGNWMKLEVR